MADEESALSISCTLSFSLQAAREEARRKRLGRQSKNYTIDNQPWKMTIREGDGKERRLKSIREESAGKHADYWVFLKVISVSCNSGSFVSRE